MEKENVVYFEDVRDRFPRVTRRNLGYPWGYVEYPRGWRLWVLPAACEAEDHFAHPYCWPGWEEVVEEGKGLVIFGPQCNNWSWEVLAAFPPSVKTIRRGYRI